MSIRRTTPQSQLSVTYQTCCWRTWRRRSFFDHESLENQNPSSHPPHIFRSFFLPLARASLKFKPSTSCDSCGRSGAESPRTAKTPTSPLQRKAPFGQHMYKLVCPRCISNLFSKLYSLLTYCAIIGETYPRVPTSMVEMSRLW